MIDVKCLNLISISHAISKECRDSNSNFYKHSNWRNVQIQRMEQALASFEKIDRFEIEQIKKIWTEFKSSLKESINLSPSFLEDKIDQLIKATDSLQEATQDAPSDLSDLFLKFISSAKGPERRSPQIHSGLTEGEILSRSLDSSDEDIRRRQNQELLQFASKYPDLSRLISSLAESLVHEKYGRSSLEAFLLLDPSAMNEQSLLKYLIMENSKNREGESYVEFLIRFFKSFQKKGFQVETIPLPADLKKEEIDRVMCHSEGEALSPREGKTLQSLIKTIKNKNLNRSFFVILRLFLKEELKNQIRIRIIQELPEGKRTFQIKQLFKSFETIPRFLYQSRSGDLCIRYALEVGEEPGDQQESIQMLWQIVSICEKESPHIAQKALRHVLAKALEPCKTSSHARDIDALISAICLCEGKIAYTFYLEAIEVALNAIKKLCQVNREMGLATFDSMIVEIGKKDVQIVLKWLVKQLYQMDAERGLFSLMREYHRSNDPAIKKQVFNVLFEEAKALCRTDAEEGIACFIYAYQQSNDPEVQKESLGVAFEESKLLCRTAAEEGISSLMIVHQQSTDPAVKAKALEKALEEAKALCRISVEKGISSLIHVYRWSNNPTVKKEALDTAFEESKTLCQADPEKGISVL